MATPSDSLCLMESNDISHKIVDSAVFEKILLFEKNFYFTKNFVTARARVGLKIARHAVKDEPNFFSKRRIFSKTDESTILWLIFLDSLSQWESDGATH